MIAALLYVLTAWALLAISNRILGPIPRRTAFVLALLPLLFTGPALLTGSVYAPVDLPYMAAPLKAIAAEHGIDRIHNGTLSDLYTQMIPWKRVVREAWLSLHWPLWNPYLFAGDLLAGSAQAAPYDPLFLISLAAPLAESLTFLAAISLMIGGLWMYCWLREIGCGDLPALLGSVGWMFGDFLVFWLEWPLGSTFRWMPLVFLAVRRVIRVRDGKSTLLLVAAFVFSILAGHPESVLHVVALAGVWGLWELRVVRPPRPIRVIGSAVLAGALALGASAVFLLPVTEAVGQTQQHEYRKAVFAKGQRSVSIDSVGQQLQAHVIPFRWGWASEVVASGAPVHPVPVTSYPGTLLLPFALIGIFASKARERTILVWFAVFGLLAGTDAPLVGDVLAKLPLFDIAINSRLVVAALFAFATLAALGAEELLAAPSRRIAIGATASVLLVIGAAVAFLWDDMMAAGLGREFLLRETSLLLIPLLLGLIALIFTKQPAQAIALIILLLAGQRAAERGAAYPTIDARAFYPSFPGLHLLPKGGDPYRITGVGFVLIPQTATMYGLEDVRGYQAMTEKRFHDTIPLWSTAQPVSFNVVTDLTDPFLSFLNVRFAIAGPGADAPEGWRVVESNEAMTLLENSRVLPRAILPQRIRINIPDEERLAQIAANDDFARVGWIEHSKGGAAPSEITNGPGRVRVASHSLNGLRLEVEMENPGWVILSQVGWHGWHARIAGRDIPIRTANHAFLGVHLPQGRHVVDFSYDPRSFYWGLAISLVTIGGTIGWIWLRRHRRRAKG
ncbi:MAG: YfhO family protein [Thermoanaerobaculia bacterium]